MQSFAKGLSHKRIRRQSGSVAMLGALWLMIAVICLATIDIGNVFWQKRELQKIADLAALAGASDPAGISECKNNSKVFAISNGLMPTDGFEPEPGFWTPLDGYKSGGDEKNACKVEVRRDVKLFFVFDSKNSSQRNIYAEAVAVRKPPLARLAVRTTLAKISTDKDAAILNALVVSLLGGSLDIDIAGWKGLAETKINLLDFLGPLSANVDINVGDYTELLNADVKALYILKAMLEAVEKNGDTANVGLSVIDPIIKLAAKVPDVAIKLADILGLQTGIPEAALNLQVNALELLQAMVQVGNGDNAAAAAVELPLGVANVGVYAKVIEKPQVSRIGNPELAKINPYGENKIYVRSAQVRLLVTTDLPAVDGLAGIVNALLRIVSPILNLTHLLTGGFLFDKDDPKITYLDAQVFDKPFRMDISIDVGGGEAYLNDFSCKNNKRSIYADVKSEVTRVRIGKIGDSASDAVNKAFATKEKYPVKPLPILDLGCLGCGEKNKRVSYYFGGLGLSIPELNVGSSENNKYKEIEAVRFDQEIKWGSEVAAQKILAGVGGGIKKNENLLSFLPADPRASPAGISGILKALAGVLGSVLGAASDLFLVVLAPLLDPILDSLLKALGVKLGMAEFGAQLSCNVSAELVK